MADRRPQQVLTRTSMRALDAFTIDSGVASLVLMERAGEAVAAFVAEHVHTLVGPPQGRTRRPHGLLVAAGSGNNGGDGLVVARLLREQGWRVRVAVCGKEPRPGSDCAINAGRWRELGGETISESELIATLARTDDDLFDLVLDALFGTGLDRPLGSTAVELVEAINRSMLPVVSVDLPSGLCADTGFALGAAVHASATVSVGAAKPGLFVGAGPDFAGRVTVADIGLLNPGAAGLRPCGELLDANAAAQLLPARARTAHKGDGGHVLIIGGSLGKTGAVLLAARGALRAGAGLVTMALPASLARHTDGAFWEPMTVELADDGNGTVAEGAHEALLGIASRFDVVVLGPGLGTSRGAVALTSRVLVAMHTPIVVDADAINVLATDRHAFARALRERRQGGRPDVIVTPHPGELGRLQATSAAAIQRDRQAAAAEFCRRNDAILVLKGAGTLVAAAGHLAFNTSGNPGMAAPGMGDVLAGVIAALVAAVPTPLEAAKLGVHVHGLAGDILEQEFEGPGYFASELADAVPEALARLREQRDEP